MIQPTHTIERLVPPVGDGDLRALAGLLVDAVESGAAVSFLAPLTLERGLDWWRRTVSACRPGTIFLVARDADGVAGTVQLHPAWAPNQPHRAEIAKLLVHRRSRRTGLGTQLMHAIERCGAARRIQAPHPGREARGGGGPPVPASRMDRRRNDPTVRLRSGRHPARRGYLLQGVESRRPIGGGTMIDVGSARFSNVYDDEARAAAYAELEFPGTYYLAYRDLPAIIAEHVRGRRALDFGCGTGRSTRFLRALGFDAVGVDISEPMLARARERDPEGEYRLVPDGDLGGLSAGTYDLVLATFTFDNIPTMEKKVTLLSALRRFLTDGGRIVNLVSAPDIYVHEWASFSTRAFPGNLTARSGDKVLIVMLDVDDRRPVEDVLWTDEAYQDVYRRAGVIPLATYRPLGRPTEAFSWVSETTVAPWVIYVLGPGT